MSGGAQADFDTLIDLITSTVAPDTWGDAPGQGSIKEFTGGLPWVHMDIAGTAWADEARPYLPKGPSGVGVRTLAELAFTHERWPK